RSRSSTSRRACRPARSIRPTSRSRPPSPRRSRATTSSSRCGASFEPARLHAPTESEGNMSDQTIRTVGILGAGQMGLGIAQVTARAGFKTILVKMTPGSVDDVRKRIETALGKEVEKGRLTAEAQKAALDNLVTTGNLKDLADADLVIESIVEHLPTKHDAFAKLEDICRPDTIFASNTSTLGITEMAVRTKRPDRFIGLHFFNPATAMKLVEIATTLATKPEVVAAVKKFVTDLGKTPVLVPDSTGFI